jgi:hypothetical protein
VNKQRSFSYQELIHSDRALLERLIEEGALDYETCIRILHLARFFGRLSQMGPAELRIRDVLTDQDLQRVWRETGDARASESVANRPLIH